MEGASPADPTPTPVGSLTANATSYFPARVVWVTGPFANRKDGPPLPAKVEAVVPVRASSLDAACVKDLKKGVFTFVQREHQVVLPVAQQKLILNGKLLLDDSALLMPLGAIHKTPAAANKGVAVFVVCPAPPKQQATDKVGEAVKPATAAAAAAATTTTTPAPADPVEVEVEISQLLTHSLSSTAADQAPDARGDNSVDDAVERKGGANELDDAPWIVKAAFVPDVTTFGSFVGSLVKAFGRRAERRDDIWSVTNLVLIVNGHALSPPSNRPAPGQTRAEAELKRLREVQRLMSLPMKQRPQTLALAPRYIRVCYTSMTQAGGGDVSHVVQVPFETLAGPRAHVTSTASNARPPAAQPSTALAALRRPQFLTALRPVVARTLGLHALPDRTGDSLLDVELVIPGLQTPSINADESAFVRVAAKSATERWVGEAWRIVYAVKALSGERIRIAPPQFAPLSATQLKGLVHEMRPDLRPELQRLIASGRECSDGDIVTLFVEGTDPMELDEESRCPGCVTKDIFLVKRVLSVKVRLTIFDGKRTVRPPMTYQLANAGAKPTVFDLKSEIRRRNSLVGGTLKMFMRSVGFDNEDAALDAYGIRLDGSTLVDAIFNPTTYSNATGGLTSNSDHSIITATPSLAHGSPNGPIVLGSMYNTVWTPPADVVRGKPVVRGIVGLNQMGNTCYLNASLQCLAQLRPLAEFFLGAPLSGAGAMGVASKDASSSTGSSSGKALSAGFQPLSVTAAMRKFFRLAWNPAIRAVTPRMVKAAVARKHAEFLGFGQQDAGQLIDCVLGDMDTEHSQLGAGEGEDEGRGAGEGEGEGEGEGSSSASGASIVQQTCTGRMKSTVTCTVCGHKSVQLDDFTCLPIPVHEPKKQEAPALPHLKEFGCEAAADSTEQGQTNGAEGGESPMKHADGGSSADHAQGGHASSKVGSPAIGVGRGEGATATSQSSESPAGVPRRRQSAGSSTSSAANVRRRPLSEPLDLGACFEAFGDVDELDGDNAYFCEKCKRRTPALKQLSLQSFPRYLIVQLKRFYFERDGVSFLSRKIHTPVRYPTHRLVLDASGPSTHMHGDRQIDSRYRARRVLPARGASARSEFEYRLCGVVNHFGSAQGGHYTATVRHANDIKNDGVGAGAASAGGQSKSPEADSARARWFNCNDSNITPVPESAAQSANAYILFYERVVPSVDEAMRCDAESACELSPQKRQDLKQQRQNAEAVEVAASLVAAVAASDTFGEPEGASVNTNSAEGVGNEEPQAEDPVDAETSEQGDEISQE